MSYRVLRAQGKLSEACDHNPQLHGRTKSLFSTMKKLLRLGDMAKGGRERDEVTDLLGMRAVLQPRADLPPDEAEQAAVQVCAGHSGLGSWTVVVYG